MESEKIKSWVYKCLSSQQSNGSSLRLEEEDIEDWTHEFLSDLRAAFKHFVQAFNELKRGDVRDFPHPPSGIVKERLKGSLSLYDLADKEGFMLFRKGYRLIFSYVRPGRVRVKFLRQQPFNETEVFVDAFINAIAGGALSINWAHENHKGFVNINVLVRYYMRRFLQET